MSFGAQYLLYLHALAKTSIFFFHFFKLLTSCVDGGTAVAVLLLGSVLGRSPASNLHWLLIRLFINGTA
jgi:hypothetical protein